MDALTRSKLMMSLERLRDASFAGIDWLNQYALSDKTTGARENKPFITYKMKDVKSLPNLNASKVEFAIQSLMSKGVVFHPTEATSPRNYLLDVGLIRQIYNEIGLPSFHESFRKPKNNNKAIVIAELNLKGGVGKTTALVSVAAGLIHSKSMIQHRLKVLVIDLDPQGSASISFGFPDSLNPTGNSAVKAMFDKVDVKTLKSWIQKTVNPGLDLLPASGFDAFFSIAAKSLGEDNNIPINQLFNKFVIEPLREDYDCILVDCGPHIDATILNVLHCTDGIMIPFGLDPLELDSTLKFITRIVDLAIASDVKNLNFNKIRFLPSKYDDTNVIHKSNLSSASTMWPGMVMNSYIPYLRAFITTFNQQETIYNIPPQTYPGDKKSLMNAKTHMDRLVVEIFNRMILDTNGASNL